MKQTHQLIWPILVFKSFDFSVEDSKWEVNSRYDKTCKRSNIEIAKYHFTKIHNTECVQTKNLTIVSRIKVKWFRLDTTLHGKVDYSPETSIGGWQKCTSGLTVSQRSMTREELRKKNKTLSDSLTKDCYNKPKL